MKEKAEGLNSNSKTRSELIGWRRNKIIELKAQGHNQEEIAQILQVSPATITAGLHYLRQEAMENVRDYTTRELPIQFKLTLAATQNAIREYWNIAQNTHDNKEKIQALENYLGCHRGLCRFLWEGGGKLEQFLIDNADKKEEKQQYKDGDMVFVEGCSPYIYRSAKASPGNGNAKGEGETR